MYFIALPSMNEPTAPSKSLVTNSRRERAKSTRTRQGQDSTT
jgi:hypothetical protein